MGYTAAESHVHADELGDTFTDEMIERINERLGRPDRCPHGWPVDTEVEQRENARARRARRARARHAGGDRAARRARRRPPALVLRRGLRARAPSVEVRDAQPAAGQLKVALDGDERAIAREGGRGHLRPRRVSGRALRFLGTFLEPFHARSHVARDGIGVTQRPFPPKDALQREGPPVTEDERAFAVSEVGRSVVARRQPSRRGRRRLGARRPCRSAPR